MLNPVSRPGLRGFWAFIAQKHGTNAVKTKDSRFCRFFGFRKYGKNAVKTKGTVKLPPGAVG
jgi:hypothetical protein